MEQSEILKHYQPELIQKLTPERYAHSLAVAQRAAALAEIHGENVEKAYTAGLLHDIMKDAEPRDQLQLLEKYGIILNRTEMMAPKIWHSFAGAVYVRHILHIEDEEIYNGIYYHTTGRAGMSRFEMLIYLADSTSSDRTFAGVEELRALSERSLSEGMKWMLKSTVERLNAQHKTVSPQSEEAYAYFCGGRKTSENQ